MPFEVRMYAILAITWFLTGIRSHLRPPIFAAAILCYSACSLMFLIIATFWFQKDLPPVWLFYMFFVGSSFYILRRHILMSQSLFVCFVSTLIVSASTGYGFRFVYVVTIAYIVLYIAYIPSGWIRSYNKMGDYSYGVYIYAFPIQQSIAASIHDVSVPVMVLISTSITFTLAIISWHIIEMNALSWKDHYVHHTRRILAARLIR